MAVLLKVWDVEQAGEARRFGGLSRVKQILIGPRRELATLVDISVADTVIDRTVETPSFESEKKRQVFGSLEEDKRSVEECIYAEVS